jgi:UDP-N-acetylmuramoylalanine--D-glutamate ligase
MKLNATKAAVLGLGTSGEAAAKLLQREGADVTVFDSADPSQLRERAQKMEALGIKTVLGPGAERGTVNFDLIVLSPGIDPQVELVQNFVRQQAEFTGELELAFRFCDKPVIAITGTNGKTTTTQLIELMLQRAGVRTVACGNIGMPFCQAIERQNDVDFFTVEVSSFQLETISTFRPHVAVWLNFTPDHLDRYRNLEEYREAKLRIFEQQQAGDFAVVNARDQLSGLKSKTITFNAYPGPADFCEVGQSLRFRGEPVLDMKATNLSGVHNAENLMAALGVAYALNIPWGKAAVGLSEYRLLPHRCERVGEVDGVVFINDSKATNLDALAKALESQSRPVILIAGGKDKGFPFDSIAELVKRKVKHAVLIGEMAARIEQSWSPVVGCTRAADLADAIAAARRNTISGDTVLFSPGTSSFDMFKNYADRGNQFRQQVQELAK